MRYQKDKNSEKPVNPFFEKVVKIDRVTKVCKGGKRLGFRVLVVVGDQKGKVSVCSTKAREVPQAIRQAVEKAKKTLISVPLQKGSLQHQVVGKQGAAKVLIKPAPPGTGIIAGGAIRVVLEAAGYRNVVAKSQGSSNPLNNAKATLNALQLINNYNSIKELRGVNFSVTDVDGTLLQNNDILVEDSTKSN